MSFHTKFLVFSDLHVDIMPDAVARMQVILEAAKQNDVDFLLDLGDTMYPDVDFLQKASPCGKNAHGLSVTEMMRKRQSTACSKHVKNLSTMCLATMIWIPVRKRQHAAIITCPLPITPLMKEASGLSR